VTSSVGPDRLAGLVGASPRPADAPMLVVGDRSLTRDQLLAAIADVGAQVGVAERVAVWATTSLATCVHVLGALAAGATVVPINPRSGERELQHLIADSDPDVLLVDPLDEEAVPAIVAGLPRGGVAGERAARGEPPGEQTAFLCYTSGTTGMPKGVQIPWRAVESNLDALAEIWAWTAADRLTHGLPLYHVHGLLLGVLGPMRRGGSLDLLPKFSPHAVHAAVERGATMLFGVPTMYHRIADELEQHPELAPAFHGLRVIVSGSAALPAAEHGRLDRLIGRPVLERYGLTETMIDLGVRHGEPPQPGYVGRPLPGVEVRLVDDDGSPLDGGDESAIGEVVVRGPNVFTGYRNRPDATAAAFRDGWFLTGDLATMDASGSFRIVGRRGTDLIKSGGYRIGAGEIESALLEHPAVAEAAVLGVPDEDLGERIAAWIVPRSGSAAVDVEALAAHVGRLLARHKVPREFHVVEALPRNGMGKVVKSELRPT
jgi:malonyl-CoA/methylmalonyl-CoA synthetase